MAQAFYEPRLHATVVDAMQDAGIDISSRRPKGFTDCACCATTSGVASPSYPAEIRTTPASVNAMPASCERATRSDSTTRASTTVTIG